MRRPDGIPSKMLDYWNKKNALSIDSMPGLRLADDLSKALVPPFKLPSIEAKQNGHPPENGHSLGNTSSASVNLTKLNLAVLLALSFTFGIIATYGYQTGSQVVAF